MDTLERLAYWKAIAADAVRAAGRDGAAGLERAVWKTEDDLFAFFDCFRPSGNGLQRVLADVVGGAEILDRLRKVYAATKDDLGGGFGYFIIRRPARATRERLLDLTRRHLEKVRQIARSAGEEELAALLAKSPQIEITYAPEPRRTQPDYDAPETVVYDMVGDWFRELNPTPSDALLLDEACYSIACDYEIARYLLWPLYRHSTEIEEPFAPYFELWTHGAKPWFGRPGAVTVYVHGDR